MIASRTARERKAERVRVLRVSEVTPMADFFVVASANNRVQLRAIADETLDRLRKKGVHLHHKEGYKETGWILLDCGDVVIHYFLEEQREFYGLERLWGDAQVVEESELEQPETSESRE